MRWIFLLLALVGCSSQRGQRLEDLPTAASFEGLATAQFLTLNAPPAGFDVADFPQVDGGLEALDGWRYVVQLEFDGVFAGTARQTAASASAEVWYDRLGPKRRVRVSTAGELLGTEGNAFEAVRLSGDTFLVRGGLCSGGEDARTAADLSAGTLIGGVQRAQPTNQRATLNGQAAWLYTFGAEDLLLPSIRVSEGGGVRLTGGEIWVAPALKAVVRFYVNLDVDNAIIFDRQIPVSGQVILRYDLYDVGVIPNITVPFGC